MDTEAKIIIAFLFNRSGKTQLKESDLYLPLSMELGWFSTKEAQEFVTYAIKHALLIKKDGLLHPSFSLEKIEIPVGFTPSKNTFNEETAEQKKEDILCLIAAEISKKTNQSEQEILEEIRKHGQEKNIFSEVAAFYVARKYDLDVTEWYDAVEQHLITGNTG